MYGFEKIKSKTPYFYFCLRRSPDHGTVDVVVVVVVVVLLLLLGGTTLVFVFFKIQKSLYVMNP